MHVLGLIRSDKRTFGIITEKYFLFIGVLFLRDIFIDCYFYYEAMLQISSSSLIRFKIVNIIMLSNNFCRLISKTGISIDLIHIKNFFGNRI